MSFFSNSGLLGRRSSRSRNASRSPSASRGLSDLPILEPPETDLAMLSPLSGAFRATRLDCRMRSAERDPSADGVGKTWEEPVDMHMLDYVLDCDTNLMCPICRSPFVDPIVLSECEHCFCRDCLRQTWNQQTYTPGIPKGNCPTCRTPNLLPARASVSRILINILDDLLVKCPKHDQGCEAQIKRGEVQEHVSNYCGYALTSCPEATCEQSIRRKDAKECLHHGVSCIDCRAETDLAGLEAHWQSSCPDRRVTCEHCHGLVLSRELISHTKDVCAAVPISCTGSAYGCDFTGTRSTIDIHTKDCTIASLAPFFETQAARIKTAEDQQKLMARRMQILEGGFRSMETMLSPSTIITASASTAEAPIITEPTPPSHTTAPTTIPTVEEPFTSPYTHLLSLHESLRNEVSRVSAALTDLDARHSMLILNENLRLKEDLAYLAGQMGGLGRQVGWLTSARLQEQQAGGGQVGGRVKL